MGSLIWIKEAGDIGPEIQITQKIMIIEQIWIYYNFDLAKKISAKLVNTKVFENFIRFPESRRQIAKFI
jgi:hypothetical protein